MASVRLVAVDPGIRGCGVAYFFDDALVAARYVTNPMPHGCRAEEARAMAEAVASGVPDATELVVEWPQVYVERIARGSVDKDPNDLLALCGVDAALAAILRVPVTSYLPAAWKGQMTKEACRARVASRLGHYETSVLDDMLVPARLAHNVWDAVGIGLHHLGRLAPRRVIPT